MVCLLPRMNLRESEYMDLREWREESEVVCFKGPKGESEEIQR